MLGGGGAGDLGSGGEVRVMTCREFKHNAASLSLLELTQAQDPHMVGHSQTCAACEGWLQKQFTLNASMHALRARTAGLEAGPDVERALLRVFRQGIRAAGTSPSTAEIAVAGMKEPMETLRPQFKAAPRSTPFALRLSRFFEIGAYAAVAAALAVAIFLGIQLLRHGSDAKPVQSKSAPERTAPVIQQPVIVANSSGAETAPLSHPSLAPKRREGWGTQRAIARKSSQRQTAAGSADKAGVSDDSQSDVDAGYMALMFCDPLSCASETQVVRMELPGPESAAGQGAQPQMADVVVGYDGVVRAVRFVN